MTPLSQSETSERRKNSRKNLVKDEDEFGETEAMAKAIDKYNYSATRQVI